MVHVLARITFRPEAAAAGHDLLAELVAATCLESGCLGYEVLQRNDAPHVFQTVERWADQAAADAHMAAAHVGKAIAAATPLLAAPPEIVSFTRVLEA